MNNASQALSDMTTHIFLKSSPTLRHDIPGGEKSAGDTPRFLLTLYKGIGDAVLMGLSALDQIVRHDPGAAGKIDVLCSYPQSELFTYDPRVNRILLLATDFFSLPEMKIWLKSPREDAKMRDLIHFLQVRDYKGIFPGMFALRFFLQFHKPVMTPHFLDLGKAYLLLRAQKDVPMQRIARLMVDRYFHRVPPNPLTSETGGQLSLYLSSEHVRNAAALVRSLKERAGLSSPAGRLLVVASDTASPATRPPVSLLAPALADVLDRYPDLLACVLQGQTDERAAESLAQQLRGRFAGRVFMIPKEPRANLLDVAAFIDQADLFLTGDTGLMHVAVARKELRAGDHALFRPKNAVKIIALFGGTNPLLFGYREQTLILGQGRKEQRRLVPGVFKESYDPQGLNLFDHISPQQVTAAIIHEMEGEKQNE